MKTLFNFKVLTALLAMLFAFSATDVLAQRRTVKRKPVIRKTTVKRTTVITRPAIRLYTVQRGQTFRPNNRNA